MPINIFDWSCWLHESDRFDATDWSCRLISADWLDCLDRLDHHSSDRLDWLESSDWLEKSCDH